MAHALKTPEMLLHKLQRYLQQTHKLAREVK